MDRDEDSEPILRSTNPRSTPTQSISSVRRKPLNARNASLQQHHPQAYGNRAVYTRLEEQPVLREHGIPNRHDERRLLNEEDIGDSRAQHFEENHNPAQLIARSGSQRTLPTIIATSSTYGSEPSHWDRWNPFRRSRYVSRDWRPWTLDFSGILVVCLLVHYALYSIGYYYTKTSGYFLTRSSSYDWLFQYGPSFLAVFFLEWCYRISVDFASIAPYLPENLSAQGWKFDKFGAKLYAVNYFRKTFQNKWMTFMMICASVLVLIQSVILVKTSDNETNRTVWIVSDEGFVVSGVLHLGLIWCIFASHIIRLPGIRLHRQTDLVRNPNTILAKVELFRRERIRNVFIGMDALSKHDAEDQSRWRLHRLALQTEATRYREKTTTVVNIPDWSQPVELDQAERPLPTNQTVLAHLRFGFVPAVLRFLTLTLAFIVLWLIFGAGIYIINHNTGYLFWTQSLDGPETFRTTLVSWLQRLVFSLFPTVILLGLRYWWLTIDTFFRISQPYVGLYNSSLGKHSVCLNYINNIDIAVTLKAIKNGHLRLAFVTTISLFVKVALALSGGLFVYREALPNGSQTFQSLQAFRGNTYSASEESFSLSVLQSGLNYSTLGTANNLGWQTGTYLFPAVNVGQGQYLMNLQGIAASLDCREVMLSFTPATLDGEITATLRDNAVGDYEWSNFCYFDQQDLHSTTSPTTVAASVATQCPTKSISTPTPLSSNITSSSISNTTSTTTNITTTPSSTSSFTNSTTILVSTPITTTPTTTAQFTSVISTSSPLSSFTTSTIATSLSIVAPPAPTRSGTTAECYDWYTPVPGDYCWEIAQAERMDWELMRQLNPDIDPDCHNLQPYYAYCVNGIVASQKVRRAAAGSTSSCTGWKYISAECDTFSTGFWVIINARGRSIPRSPTIVGLADVTSSTAMLCTPNYRIDTVNATVINNSSGVNITVNNVLNTNNLFDKHWTGNDGTSFGEYFSSSLVQYGFTGSFSQVSDSNFIDMMSLMAASNSTQGIDAFQNPDEFKRVVSYAFGLAFTLVANQTIASDKSTWLMDAVDPNSYPSQITGRTYDWKAFVETVPIYAIVIVLGLCAISLLFVYPGKSRRMPLDPSFIANVVASIYDSSIITAVGNIVEQGGNPIKELRNERFSFGVLPGITGQNRLGIDFQLRVNPIIYRSHGLQRRLPWTSDHDHDAEKQSRGSTSSSEVPELAQCMSPQELESRGDYYVSPIQFSTTGFQHREQQQHGQAVETGYAPVPIAMSDDVSYDGGIQRPKKGFRFFEKFMKIKRTEPVVRIRPVSGPSSTENSSGDLELERQHNVSAFGARLKNLLMGPLGKE